MTTRPNELGLTWTGMSSHELSDTVERVLQLCDTYFEDTPLGSVRVPAVAGAHGRAS